MPLRDRSAPRPDFIGIGAHKAGTTWLAANLFAHPKIWKPFRKEVHYFDSIHMGDDLKPRAIRTLRRQLREAIASGKPPERIKSLKTLLKPKRMGTPDWYADVFRPAPAGQLTGEITPLYLLLPEAGIDDLRSTAPAAKLICLIRDPADRARSAFRMHLKRVKIDQTDAAAVEAAGSRWMGSMGARSGDYADALPRWEARAEPGRELLYLPFGRIKTDPQAVMRQVESFLGLPPHDAYPKLSEAVNRTPSAALPAQLDAAIEAHCAPHRAWLEARFPPEFVAQLR